MNKILKGLMVAALAVSAAQVNAHTNKTFLLPRSQGVNLPMEHTTFYDMIHRKSCDKYGTNYQVVPFYQAATDESATAKYFLINNKSTINLQGKDAVTALAAGEDFKTGYIIHGATANDATTKGSISLDPRYSSWGFRMDYHQDLCKILKGLYFKASAPIVRVESDPRLSTSGAGLLGDGIAQTGGTQPSVGSVLRDYFAGNYASSRTVMGAGFANGQQALQYAKIDGKQVAVGVADLDLALGWKFWQGECFGAGIAFAVTVPTGKDATGEYLFQPMVGNGRHFGIGADFNGHARVWGDDCANLSINLTAKYRYLLESQEIRTLGIKGRNFGQYTNLVAANDAKESVLRFIPAANVTTLDVNVTPGSQFDGLLGLEAHAWGFNFELGYNLYFREEEKVRLQFPFADNKYAVAAVNASGASTANPHVGTEALVMTAAAATNLVDGASAASLINSSTLDTDAAQTPSQFTNSLFAGIGYIFGKHEAVPVMLNIGGKYEWAAKNSALSQWDIYGKVGFGF